MKEYFDKEAKRSRRSWQRPSFVRMSERTRYHENKRLYKIWKKPTFPSKPLSIGVADGIENYDMFLAKLALRQKNANHEQT